MSRGRAGLRARSQPCVAGRVFATALAFTGVTAVETGCAGGGPLLHPAQTLAAGAVRAAGGFSATFAAGNLADATRNAQSEVAAGPARADVTFAKGALVTATIAPGLAPWVSARAGLGEGFEAGLATSGRSVRLDLRRSVDATPHWAVAAGVGASAVLTGRGDGTSWPLIDLSSERGWGVDVPVLVGYESDGRLYAVWLGARAGAEHIDATAAAGGGGLSATRVWGGGVLGLAAGFRHVHVAFELDASYASASGDVLGTHAKVDGVALTPASAVWWRF
jgi:hypothetical protein